jgi:predicted aspartyl protease
MTVSGVVIEGAPVIYAQVRGGRLYLGSRGTVRLVVATGFAGALALPERLARELRGEFIARGKFILATGHPVDLPMFTATAQIGGRRVNTWFIAGDALIGMEFLQDACSAVSIDLDARTIDLHVR